MKVDTANCDLNISPKGAFPSAQRHHWKYDSHFSSPWIYK